MFTVKPKNSGNEFEQEIVIKNFQLKVKGLSERK